MKIDHNMKKHQRIQLSMLEKSLKILNNNGFLVYVVAPHPFETIDVIAKIAKTKILKYIILSQIR